MTVPVDRHSAVRQDIKDIAHHIAESSLDAALRFAPAVEATLRGLAEMPGKGSPKAFDDPRLSGVRSYAVNGFPNHLILYRRQPDGGILILGVTHGARNLPAWLRRRR